MDGLATFGGRRLGTTFWSTSGASNGATNLVSAVSIGGATFWHIMSFPLNDASPSTPRLTPSSPAASADKQLSS